MWRSIKKFVVTNIIAIAVGLIIFYALYSVFVYNSFPGRVRVINANQIFVDSETGVMYFCPANGGTTYMVNPDGTPKTFRGIKLHEIEYDIPDSLIK